MARPSNPTRKTTTLARAVDYVLEQGLADLSLRPLAAALGTSTRMLLYDFGSKEQLVADVLAEIRRREAALFDASAAGRRGVDAETLHWIWDWISADERVPFLRLFFEVYVDAMNHPERYAGEARRLVDDWLAVLRPRVDPATATLLIAVVRGLLLDRLTAPDPERTDAAFERFAAMYAL
jgi:AcrR family transcriptional regulator